MIVDGKNIADRIKQAVTERVSLLDHGPVLAVVTVGENPVTKRFVDIKRIFAADVGIHMEEHHYGDTIDADTLLAKIEDLALDSSIDGIVLQLPLPEHIDTEAVLGAIPINKDVDVISQETMARFAAGSSRVLPPVVGACKEILEDADIDVREKKAVVIGKGNLVGWPAATWLTQKGAEVTALDRSEQNLLDHTLDADIIVLGAGEPGILTPNMIQEGVVILDAGTSETGGKLSGDADAECATKASVFTPVPGGIGPITVAILFKNVIDLYG
jgi:methylenetetrahydrofolate dehydrogenase (NADP+)/methenyltetrahydrofolate cyclohydrolase